MNMDILETKTCTIKFKNGGTTVNESDIDNMYQLMNKKVGNLTLSLREPLVDFIIDGTSVTYASVDEILIVRFGHNTTISMISGESRVGRVIVSNTAKYKFKIIIDEIYCSTREDKYLDI